MVFNMGKPTIKLQRDKKKQQPQNKQTLNFNFHNLPFNDLRFVYVCIPGTGAFAKLPID